MSDSRRTLEQREPNVTLESRQLTEFDAVALTHVVEGGEFEHCRLPGGCSDMNLLQFALPNAVLNRGSYAPAVLIEGTFSRNAVTLGTMLCQQHPTIVNGVPVKMCSVQFYAENSEICYRAWPNGTWLAFVIPRERLLEFCLENFDGIPRLPDAGITHMEPAPIISGTRLLNGLRDLDQSLRLISLHSNDPERIGESVERDLLARLGGIVCNQSVMRRGGDRRRLRHCREMIGDSIKLVERDPEEMLDLQSMAKAAGLSPRTLQRHFQAEFGLCPQEWFRVQRLNSVRKDLLNGGNGGSVTRTATRWGFFHLSRFARYYSELFGEKPSETLHHRRSGVRANAASI